jgi:CcmD family protein
MNFRDHFVRSVPSMRSILFRMMLVLLPMGAVPGAAAADTDAMFASVQSETAAATSQAAGAGAEPAQVAPARSMRAYWHVFIAFGITWALIFGFAVSIGRRFDQLAVEVQRMSGGR